MHLKYHLANVRVGVEGHKVTNVIEKLYSKVVIRVRNGGRGAVRWGEMQWGGRCIQKLLEGNFHSLPCLPAIAKK